MSDSVSNKLFACLGVSILIIGSLILAPIVEGFVFNYLWQWFITPVFQIASPGLPMLIGLSLTVSFLTFQYTTNQPKDERPQNEKLITAIYVVFGRPFVILFMGWVIHLFTGLA